MDRELLTCCPGLDGVVIGEAEETISEIADRFYYKCWKDKTLPSRFDFLNKSAEIKGILTKDKTLRRRDPILPRCAQDLFTKPCCKVFYEGYEEVTQ